MLPGIMPVIGVNGFRASYVSGSINTTAATSYTFSSLSFGDPHPSRRIIVALASADISGNTAHSAVAMTVGGGSASVVSGGQFSFRPSSQTELNVEFWQISQSLFSNPLATSGNVAISGFGGETKSFCGVALFRLENGAASPSDVQSATVTNAATAGNVNVSVPGNGVIMSAAAWFSSGNFRAASFAMRTFSAGQVVSVGGSFSGSDYSWTGVDEVLEGARSVTTGTNNHINGHVSWGA